MKKTKLNLKSLNVGQQISQEQYLLQSMFGGSDPTWGTGENLPKFSGVLFTGEGLIKSGDDGETGRMFGI